MTRARQMRPKPLLLLASVLCFGPTGASAQIIEYAHLDAVGNVRAVTDQNGVVIERHDYLPFGEEWNPQPGNQPLRFTGKERDTETGLDYFGARYYKANIGRFTTTDPAQTIKENILDPQRWNKYAYGRNNPLRFVDPDGRDVSIALNFMGTGWTSQDRGSIIGQVASWYSSQGVGNVYVFDAATMEHGAWFASFRPGYADMEVTSASASGTKHVRDKVFAGDYAKLGAEERLNAISNSIIHETAAHQFHGTLGEALDQINYSRDGMPAGDPQLRRRWGTVADSYAYGDPKTRSKVTGGPIPIDPDDRRTLVGRVGPQVKVEPPVKK